MDKLTHYRNLIKNHLSEIETICRKNPTPGVETLVAFDEQRDHYLLLGTGWVRKRRESGVTLFVRLCEGKIWIEEDGTEEGIANVLLRAGVPPEDIVLAFHPPETRHLTELTASH